MALTGRTLTKHFHIETKQHELFNLDLGEGIPRRMLMFGVGVAALWVLLLIPVLGAPTTRTSSFYMVPPFVFAYFGYKESVSQPRRKNITQWAVRARYVLSGHRPIISLGARAAYRNEYIPAVERIPFAAFIRKFAPKWTSHEWEMSTDEINGGEIQTGRPIVLAQSSVLYGFDYMTQLRQGKRR